MVQRIFLIAVSVIASFSLNLSYATAQLDYRFILPEAFQGDVYKLVGQYEVASKIDWSAEQKLLKRKIHDLFVSGGGDIELLDLRDRLIDEIKLEIFLSLTDTQKEQFDRAVVQTRLRSIMRSTFRQVIEEQELVGISLAPNEKFLTAKFLSKFTDMDKQQYESIVKLQDEFFIKLVDRPGLFEKKRNELFELWQQTLFVELLPFQKENYRQALGGEYQFPEFLNEFVSSHKSELKYQDSGIFVDDGFVILSGKEPLNFILKTPFYIDAPYFPTAVVALLLHQELEAELELSDLQKQQLEALNSRSLKAFPLQNQLDIQLNFGRNRSTKEQRRESLESDEVYGAFVKELETILKPQQSQRIRQIWNRILIELAWSEIPLAFPDWQDYLEFSASQRKRYEEIQADFESRLKRLSQERQEFQTREIQEFNRKAWATLHPRQQDLIGRLLPTD